MPGTSPTWNSIARKIGDQVEEVSGLLRDFGPELRPPGEAGIGERGFAVGRPYHFLPRKVLDAISRIAVSAPWSAEVARKTTLRQRERIIRDCFDEAVSGAWGRAAIVAYLEKRAKRLGELSGEYEFVFPLDNVEIHYEAKLIIGPVEVRPLGSDLWQRFTNEVVQAAIAQGNPVGPRVANNLFGEEILRAPRWANGFVAACMVVKATGLPNSAYASAREHALFALAALAAHSETGWERYGNYIALKGEQLERSNGIRFRFASSQLQPDHIIDGVGPSLQLRIAKNDTWPLAKAAHKMHGLASLEPAKYVMRSIYWLGHALNQPTFYDDEAEELGPNATDVVLRPTRVEVGLRLRTLITAVEASFKLETEDTDTGKTRFGRALRAADSQFYAERWSDICQAYEARHAWTHGGAGAGTRIWATALAEGLQLVLPGLADRVHRIQAATFAQMHDEGS